MDDGCGHFRVHSGFFSLCTHAPVTKNIRKNMPIYFDNSKSPFKSSPKNFSRFLSPKSGLKLESELVIAVSNFLIHQLKVDFICWNSPRKCLKLGSLQGKCDWIKCLLFSAYLFHRERSRITFLHTRNAWSKRRDSFSSKEKLTKKCLQVRIQGLLQNFWTLQIQEFMLPRYNNETSLAGLKAYLLLWLYFVS